MEKGLTDLKWEIEKFPRSMTKGKLLISDGSQTDEMYGIPDGIIAHLTREYGGTYTTATSLTSRRDRSRRRLKEPVRIRGHLIAGLIWLRRMCRIWKLV
jgi:hypothetical protein